MRAASLITSHYLREAYGMHTRFSDLIKLIARGPYYEGLRRIAVNRDLAERLDLADRESHRAALVCPGNPRSAFRKFLNMHENMPQLNEKIRLMKEIVLQLRAQAGARSIRRSSLTFLLDAELTRISGEIARTPVTQISKQHAHVELETSGSGYAWLAPFCDATCTRLSITLSETQPDLSTGSWETLAGRMSAARRILRYGVRVGLPATTALAFCILNPLDHMPQRFTAIPPVQRYVGLDATRAALENKPCTPPLTRLDLDDSIRFTTEARLAALSARY